MIRVLVADDHAVVRDGVKHMLLKHDDITVAGEAASGNEVLAMIREQDWDVLVTDMSMPGRNGIELIKLVKAARPELPVLVLSMYSEDQYAVRAIRAGAAGYLNKERVTAQLAEAIRKVVSGGVYASTAVTEALFHAVRGEGVVSHERLSDREFQVLCMIAAGKSTTEIAAELSLSIKTVSTHKSHILGKMQMHNQADLIRYAIEHKLVDAS